MVDWERNWRANGIGSAVFFISAYAIDGGQPKVGLSGGTA
jgi:hypothetical protein